MRVKHGGMIVAGAWVLLAGGAAALAQRPVRLQVPHGRLVVSQRGAATVVTYLEHGVRRRAVLPLDETIHPRSLDSAEVLGSLADRVFMLRISYASSPHGGMHQCGAGTETMVRVVRFGRASSQTFAQTIESCWLPIGEGSAEWNAGQRTLTIARTNYGQDPPVASKIIYAVGDDGSVHAQEAEPAAGQRPQE